MHICINVIHWTMVRFWPFRIAFGSGERVSLSTENSIIIHQNLLVSLSCPFRRFKTSYAVVPYRICTQDDIQLTNNG